MQNLTIKPDYRGCKILCIMIRVKWSILILNKVYAACSRSVVRLAGQGQALSEICLVFCLLCLCKLVRYFMEFRVGHIRIVWKVFHELFEIR
jgi:hypothetical protein